MELHLLRVLEGMREEVVAMTSATETTYHYAYWGGTFAFLICNNCGNVLLKDWHSNYRHMKPPRFCDNCGRRIGKRVKVSDKEKVRLALAANERRLAR